MIFTSKLPGVQTSIFSIMSKMAQDYNAINLSQGYPNFKSDPRLIHLVNKAMQEGYNYYAPMPGIIELREAIAQKTEYLYNVKYKPESEITITAGATQAIFTIIGAFVRPGDEVIIFEPAYDSYRPSIELFGGIVIPVEMQGDNFEIDWAFVKDRITKNTKMILINTPHNPSGTVWCEDDFKALEALVAGTDIIVLSDEVYEQIVFDGIPYRSVAHYPELSKYSFITASFGKIFHNTGWKVGYCMAPKELMSEFRKVHQFNVFSVNHPVQKALSHYMQQPETYLHLSELFQKKRDFFLQLIKDSRFTFTPSKGTYFQILDYSSITKENDVEFSKRLCVDHKLSSIPVSVFSSGKTERNKLRFCFAKTDDTLRKAADILNSI